MTAATTHERAERQKLQPLGPGDFEVLEFARTRWASPGRRETAIRERFNHSELRFTQRLQALLDHPDALAYDPQLVRREHRLRDLRRRSRGLTQ